MIDRKYRNVTEALVNFCDDMLLQPTHTSRNGDVKSMRHVALTLSCPLERYIQCGPRKANVVAQIAETMWVLAGRNDVEWLSHYLPRAADFSDDGQTWRAGYGPRLRKWADGSMDGVYVDQLAEVVRLLREDINTRRAVISIFDPALDYVDSKDIPCNNWLSFSAEDGKLDLHVAIRSNDLIWGWSGINQFEWSVLLEIVAGMVGVEVGKLHFSITNLHIYQQHWERAKQIAQWPATMEEDSYLPSAATAFNATGLDDAEALDNLLAQWFHAEKLIRGGASEATILQVVDNFPEPMLQSWLQALVWWWHPDFAVLSHPHANQMGTALRAGVRNPRESQAELPTRAETVPFVDFVTALHDEKHRAYGDSWKRRGEMLGIMANCARKVDRLGVAGAGDTASDTAIDLLVYLAKYRWWLVENAGAPTPKGSLMFNTGTTYTDDTAPANVLIKWLSNTVLGIWEHDVVGMISHIRDCFDTLEAMVIAHDSARYTRVDRMLMSVFPLAKWLYENEGLQP